MPKKENVKDVSELSEGSKSRFDSMLRKLYEKNITITKAKKMTNDELRIALDSKGNDITMKAYKRVLDQMTFDKERRYDTIDNSIDSMGKIEVENKDWDKTIKAKLRKDLIRISGSGYFEIVESLMINHKDLSEKEAQYLAKDLLMYKNDAKIYEQYDERDKEVLAEYSP